MIDETSEPTGVAPLTGQPEFRAELLRAVRDELARADAKAALLFASAGVVAGALGNAVISGQWTPLRLPAAAQWAWWPGFAAGLAALVLLALAVYPRIRRRDDAGPFVSFYGDVMRLSRTELDAALSASAESADRRAADQIFELSSIVATKYRHIRTAIRLFGLSAVLLALALLVGWAHTGI